MNQRKRRNTIIKARVGQRVRDKKKMMKLKSYMSDGNGLNRKRRTLLDKINILRSKAAARSRGNRVWRSSLSLNRRELVLTLMIRNLKGLIVGWRDKCRWMMMMRRKMMKSCIMMDSSNRSMMMKTKRQSSMKKNSKCMKNILLSSKSSKWETLPLKRSRAIRMPKKPLHHLFKKIRIRNTETKMKLTSRTLIQR